MMVWGRMLLRLVFAAVMLGHALALSVDTGLATQLIDRITDINLSASLVRPHIVLVQSPDGSNQYDYIVVVVDIDATTSLSGSEEHIVAISKPANTTSVVYTADESFPLGAYTHYKVFSYSSAKGTRSQLMVLAIVDRAQDARPSGFASVNFQDMDYTYKKAKGDIHIHINPANIATGSQIYVCFQVSWSTKLDRATSNCVVNGTVYNGTCSGSESTCQFSFSMNSSVDISATPYLVAYQRTKEKDGDEFFSLESEKAGGQVNEPVQNSSTVVFDVSANYDFVDKIVGNTESPRVSTIFGPTLQQNSGLVGVSWVAFSPPDPYTSDTPVGALTLSSAVFLGPSNMVSHPALLDNNLDSIACELPATGGPGSINNVTLYQEFSFDNLRYNCSLSASGLVLSGELVQVIWDVGTGNVELQLRAAVTIDFSELTAASSGVTLDNVVIQHGLEQDITTPSEITFWSPGFFRLAQKSVFEVDEVMYVEHSTHANSFFMSLTRAYFSDQAGSRIELELDTTSLVNQDNPAQPGRFRFTLRTPVVMNCFDICWLHCESKLYSGSKSLGPRAPKSTQSSHALVMLDRRQSNAASQRHLTMLGATVSILVASRLSC